MKKWYWLAGLAVVLCCVLLLMRFCSTKDVAIHNGKSSNIADVFTSEIHNADLTQEIPDIDSSADDDTSKYTPTNNKVIDADSVETSNTQDKIHGWGLVRNKNNQPPQPSKGQKELLENHGGKYLGDTSKKVIYLTFDEGYENGYTPVILDTLKQKNVSACFFITGPYLKSHSDLVQRMVEEGHTVGNHTVNHPSLPTVSDEKVENEVIELDRVFTEKFGKSMRFLRPPKGEFSERTLKITQRIGYTNVMWSFAYADWDINNQKGADYAHQIVTDNLHNGAIILLHAVSKDNANALGRIVDTARQLGYEFGSIENIS